MFPSDLFSFHKEKKKRGPGKNFRNNKMKSLAVLGQLTYFKISDNLSNTLFTLSEGDHGGLPQTLTGSKHLTCPLCSPGLWTWGWGGALGNSHPQVIGFTLPKL